MIGLVFLVCSFLPFKADLGCTVDSHAQLTKKIKCVACHEGSNATVSDAAFYLRRTKPETLFFFCWKSYAFLLHRKLRKNRSADSEEQPCIRLSSLCNLDFTTGVFTLPLAIIDGCQNSRCSCTRKCNSCITVFIWSADRCAQRGVCCYFSAGWVSSNPLMMGRCSSHATYRESQGLSALGATVKPWQAGATLTACCEQHVANWKIFTCHWRILLNVCIFYCLFFVLLLLF